MVVIGFAINVSPKKKNGSKVNLTRSMTTSPIGITTANYTPGRGAMRPREDNVKYKVGDTVFMVGKIVMVDASDEDSPYVVDIMGHKRWYNDAMIVGVIPAPEPVEPPEPPSPQFQVGDLVAHKEYPNWGLGRVLQVGNDTLWVRYQHPGLPCTNSDNEWITNKRNAVKVEI